MNVRYFVSLAMLVLICLTCPLRGPKNRQYQPARATIKAWIQEIEKRSVALPQRYDGPSAAATLWRVFQGRGTGRRALQYGWLYSTYDHVWPF